MKPRVLQVIDSDASLATGDFGPAWLLGDGTLQALTPDGKVGTLGNGFVSIGGMSALCAVSVEGEIRCWDSPEGPGELIGTAVQVPVLSLSASVTHAVWTDAEGGFFIQQRHAGTSPLKVTTSEDVRGSAIGDSVAFGIVGVSQVIKADLADGSAETIFTATGPAAEWGETVLGLASVGDTLMLLIAPINHADSVEIGMELVEIDAAGNQRREPFASRRNNLVASTLGVAVRAWTKIEGCTEEGADECVVADVLFRCNM